MGRHGPRRRRGRRNLRASPGVSHYRASRWWRHRRPGWCDRWRRSRMGCGRWRCGVRCGDGRRNRRRLYSRSRRGRCGHCRAAVTTEFTLRRQGLATIWASDLLYGLRGRLLRAYARGRLPHRIATASTGDGRAGVRSPASWTSHVTDCSLFNRFVGHNARLSFLLEVFVPTGS